MRKHMPVHVQVRAHEQTCRILHKHEHKRWYLHSRMHVKAGLHVQIHHVVQDPFRAGEFCQPDLLEVGPDSAEIDRSWSKIG